MTREEKMLRAVQEHVLPYTRQEVARGNHVFGGAVLRKDTLEVVVVGSNNRLANPIFHGEVDTLNRFYALPERPVVTDLIFLATHDPCPMCAAAIAWAGFNEVWTLFDYTDVQDSFDMPVDLIMYRELFGSNGVQEKNPFYTRHSLKAAIAGHSEKERLMTLLDEIEAGYAALNVQDFAYPGML